MQDYELKILEKISVKYQRHPENKGCVFFCDTDEGVFLLKEAAMSEKKIPALYKLCENLKDRGFERIDQLVANVDGEYFSTSEDGKKIRIKILVPWPGVRYSKKQRIDGRGKKLGKTALLNGTSRRNICPAVASVERRIFKP